MKGFIFLLFSLVLSTAAWGYQFSSTIHSIEPGNSHEPALVRFDNGRVVFVKNTEKAVHLALSVARERKEVILVDANKDNYLSGAQSVGIIEDKDDPKTWSTESYQPSIISLKTAGSVFKNMRRNYTKNGECYNRAHIWAYETFNKTSLNGMKIFMFFTNRYIRKYKYNWWFHVTPMYYVGNLDSPRTLDRRYTHGPLQTKTWSDVFIKSKRRCKKVELFNDYWNGQKTEDCYHIHASMYYIMPRDIEKRDLYGIEKTDFEWDEIRKAYKNGFNMDVRAEHP
jgi:hypothetical protein